ncbi:hypothetical protein Nmel_002343 [Mimus melanotis]
MLLMFQKRTTPTSSALRCFRRTVVASYLQVLKCHTSCVATFDLIFPFASTLCLSSKGQRSVPKAAAVRGFPVPAIGPVNKQPEDVL